MIRTEQRTGGGGQLLVEGDGGLRADAARDAVYRVEGNDLIVVSAGGYTTTRLEGQAGRLRSDGTLAPLDEVRADATDADPGPRRAGSRERYARALSLAGEPEQPARADADTTRRPSSRERYLRSMGLGR